MEKTQIGGIGRNLISLVLGILLFGIPSFAQVTENNGLYTQAQDGDLLLVKVGEKLELNSVRPSAVDLSGKIPKGFRGVQMSFLVEGGGLGRTPMDWLFLIPDDQKILTQLDRALVEKWTLLEVETATGTTLEIQFQSARKFSDPHMGQESHGIKLRFIRSIKFRDGEGQIQRLSVQKDLGFMLFPGRSERFSLFLLGDLKVRSAGSYQMDHQKEDRLSSAGQ